jgi:hypothetical protein
MVLQMIAVVPAAQIIRHAALTIAILAAASCAFVIRLYQGRRAAFIVAQLSVLFSVLFMISSENLWTVMLCPGFLRHSGLHPRCQKIVRVF